MILYARYFSFPGADDRWDRMANVLQKSCDMHGVKNDIQKMPVPELTRGASVLANHHKLKEWCAIVQEAQEPVLLTDVDVFLQANPCSGFDGVEHVGITYRDQGLAKMPINAGVVFVQPTAEAKQFFLDWTYWDQRLMGDTREWLRWREKYQGMNQSSLGALLETSGFAPTKLNCSAWNNVEPWTGVETAAIVHVKGNCLRHLFDGQALKWDGGIEACERWIGIENADLSGQTPAVPTEDSL